MDELDDVLSACQHILLNACHLILLSARHQMLSMRADRGDQKRGHHVKRLLMQSL
jgi:hypothetical protein